MWQYISKPLPAPPFTLMEKAGYAQHCVEDGRICFHRRINDVPFPRFHLYLSILQDGIELDLHFDQLSIDHSSNHNEQWAYQGGRVDQELRRIVEVIKGKPVYGEINKPLYQDTVRTPTAKQTKKRGLFDLILDR